MKVYRCGIIGLGRQGAGIPEPYPVDKPRSHKEAYEMHPRCELVRGIDTICQDREFGLPQPIDIWSICTPADEHLWAVVALLKPGDPNHRPLAIFCEKPLAPTLQECDEIISLCEQKQVILAVNHQRAWEEHGEVVYRGSALETGTHAAEIATRHGWALRKDCTAGEPELAVQFRGYGPGVSLRALDDIIACIEGRKRRPACDGWAGREAVRAALESEIGIQGGQGDRRTSVREARACA